MIISKELRDKTVAQLEDIIRDLREDLTGNDEYDECLNRDIVSLRTAVNAINSCTPKECKRSGVFNDTACPSCSFIIRYRNKKPSACRNCGQALEWWEETTI